MQIVDHTFRPPSFQKMKWLVLRTKPQLERMAMLHLEQREVKPYCPMYQEPKWHPRAPKGPVPMFKGYVFVHCEFPKKLNAVRYCPGVMMPVSFNGRIATVGQEVIDALRIREGERGFARAREEEEGIPIGTQVRVMDGPLKGLEGIFDGYMRGDERARVLMQFLRAQKPVEVDATSLAMVVP